MSGPAWVRDQGVGLSENPLQPEARVPGCEGTEVRMVKTKA